MDTHILAQKLSEMTDDIKITMTDKIYYEDEIIYGKDTLQPVYIVLEISRNNITKFIHLKCETYKNGLDVCVCTQPYLITNNGIKKEIFDFKKNIFFEKTDNNLPAEIHKIICDMIWIYYILTQIFC